VDVTSVMLAPPRRASFLTSCNVSWLGPGHEDKEKDITSVSPTFPPRASVTLDPILTDDSLWFLRARERSERQPSCEAGCSSPRCGASVTLDPILTCYEFIAD